jgi:hypothetical protein
MIGGSFETAVAGVRYQHATKYVRLVWPNCVGADGGAN